MEVMRMATDIDRKQSSGPLSQGTKSSTSKGKICLICDRKFILYDYYSEFACQLEELDGEIKDHQEMLRERC
jgi:uncharacterized protein (UPF0254 family)